MERGTMDASHRKPSFLVVFVASLALGIARFAFAQVSTGAILGTVSDPSGAVVPNAQVTVTDLATGVKRVGRTGAGGLYDFEALPAAGTLYSVSIEKQGFRTYTSRGIRLDPGSRVAVNVKLVVGSVASQVTVTASSVRVNTTSGASSGTIGGTEVQELQLNGRDFRGLALLVPGVNSTSITGSAVGGDASLNGGGLTGETPISVNGLGREMNLYVTDGAYNMNTGNMINLNVVQPISSIQEFRILKDNYSAKYGIAGGAVIMLATKSGTREFHGGAYDFLRNDALDARNFFSPTIPALKQNIFGGDIGGPVYIPGHYNTDKTKTFFFADVEFRRRNAADVATGAMPTAAMRAGNFSASPTLAPGGLTPDASSQAILAQEHPGINCISGNQINSACFDPNAVTLMNKFFPLPNDVVPGIFNNYLNNSVEVFKAQDHTYRVDQNFGDKYRLLARVSYENTSDALPNNIGWGGNPAPTEKATINETGFNNLLQFTADINPTTINQVGWTQTDDKPRLLIANQFLKDISPALTVKMPYGFADPEGRSPDMNISSGWASINNGGLPVYASDGEQIFSDDFTKVKGSHTIQAGTLFIFGIKRQNNFATSEGSYSFSGVHSGDPVADFLLGLDSSFNQNNTLLRGYFRYHQSESYIQDDWKVTRKLTLNLGLRLQYYSSDKMQGNGTDDFEFSKWNAADAPAMNPNGTLIVNAQGQPVTASGSVASLVNGLVFPQDYQPTSRVLCGTTPCAGTPGVPDGFFTTPSINWAPRFGFAWDPTGSGKTAIRGGYGIGYGRIPFAIYNGLGNPPFESSVTLLNGSLTNPSFGSPGAISAEGLALLGVGGQYRPDEIQSWSLTVSRQLNANGVLSVAYVGTAGRNIPGSPDWNFPLPVAGPTISNPGCLQPGETIPSGGFQFDPCTNAGLVSADYTRPYRGWGSMTGEANSAAQFYGTSNYNSLQAGYRYNARHGLTFTAAYTYGHDLSDVRGGGFGSSRNTGSGAQNPRDFEAEYGPPGWDRTQIFTSGYIYNLPFLKGRPGLVGRALGDWTFSGITVIESGFVFDPGLSTSTPGLASRPDCVGTIGGPKTVNEWFNTGAFTAPAFGFFGNCGTGTIRGPGEDTWSWSLYKTFPITERANVQFRAEAFNIWNHTNFAGLNSSLGSPGFGQITSALDPRILEFALQFQF
jgi:hypothetical protein